MDENAKIYEPQAIGENNLRNTLIQDPKLFAEKILKSEAVTCSITIPVQGHALDRTQSITTTIPFYMSNDFSLGTLSNTWSDLIDMNGGNAFTDFLNRIQVFQNESQVTMQSEAMSSKVWKGSKFSGFTVECLFVSTRRKLNPSKIIRLLAAACLPDKLRSGESTTAQGMDAVKNGFNAVIEGGAGFINTALDGVSVVSKALAGRDEQGNQRPGIDVTNAKNAVTFTSRAIQSMVQDIGMVAPLYYGIKKRENSTTLAPLANTTLTLQIGDWFRADELLVESISNITFSKEVIAPPAYKQKDLKSMVLYPNSPDGADYGYPLWGKCSLTLVPFSMMNKTKFESYFIDKTTDTAVDGIIGNLLGGIGVNNVVNFADTTIDRFTLP